VYGSERGRGVIETPFTPNHLRMFLGSVDGWVFCYERFRAMSRNILTVLAVGFVGLGLCAGYANAGLLYQNHYNDMTGITASGGGTVAISSDHSADPGGTSLKLTDGGTAAKALTSTGVTDTTTTWIASLYLAGDAEDHANFTVGDSAFNFGAYCSRYPSTLYAWDGTAGVQLTSVPYPTDQWVTIGMVVNGPTGKYDLYFAPGTTLTTSNLVLSGATMRNEASAWDCLGLTKSSAGQSMYLDELRVYSGLGEGITAPEPSAIALLATGLLGIVCYAWRKRK
jgi:hypothetical protein